MTYDVEVTRDGRWWMISIPALDGLTQARRFADVEEEAIDYIAVTTDVPKSTVSVSTRVIVDDIDATEKANMARDLKAMAAHYEASSSDATRDIVQFLATRDVPYRDIGAIVGISPQRAHQLVEAMQKHHPASA
ncbi:HicB family toxin-antitoxin system [Williamsia muralis]|uniref:HicB family toxin-antitoxin system n=1 Tax=Williamsia marianensis TaxID=85044 RepID=UPI000DB399F5|nr:HicB family toxin-antitoxin system [Williamsia marianensis]PVY23636.1 hypothetical protein C7458_1237 [Williamsia marianensis]PZT97509.1 MAG: HicB family toxin-antitoxin system [Gordonia sp. (in: high G+C Gram-positive bacteria)]